MSTESSSVPDDSPSRPSRDILCIEQLLEARTAFCVVVLVGVRRRKL